MLPMDNQESGKIMRNIVLIRCLSSVILIGAFLCCSVVAAETLTYAIGDRVSLRGTAYVTDTMYIFVTGPGLDPNGVNPDQMKSPVVSGNPSTFVQVDVENDSWSYIWNTAQQGFSLREGTYTIYAISQPVAKNALPAVYGTIEISLSRGGEPRAANGEINITTSPPGATVYIDSRFAGITPGSFEAASGTHTLRIENPGYQTILDTVKVTDGEAIMVRKILMPAAPVTATATISPATQTPRSPLPTVPTGTNTPKAPLTAGIVILATTFAILSGHLHRKK